jgi:hypothetical protein
MGSSLMTRKVVYPIQTERCSGGTRLRVPLADAPTGVELARFDWSCWRPASDRLGNLTRVLDIPSPEMEDEMRPTVNEAFLRFPPDIAPAPKGGIEDGIEIENATYLPDPCRPSRWEYSRQWNRLRGCVTLAPAPRRMSGRFLNYLHRLNNDIRFARIGLEGGDQLAVQVVLPCDAHWRDVAAKALDFVVRLVLPQLAWWTGPRELVDDLLETAGW